jgi:GNAT superfamily N-acetyltransferase
MIRPATAEDIPEIKKLFLEYQNAMGFTPCFQNFDQEIETLPGKYAGPRGALFIGRDSQGLPIGTVALRPTELEDTCEMKRLYVTPAGRGTGLGRELMEAIFHAARERKYRFMRLDTFRGKMDRAIAMYRAAGFTEIPAWYDDPLPDIVCLQKEL